MGFGVGIINKAMQKIEKSRKNVISHDLLNGTFENFKDGT